jgi:hypothetical protein
MIVISTFQLGFRTSINTCHIIKQNGQRAL